MKNDIYNYSKWAFYYTECKACSKMTVICLLACTFVIQTSVHTVNILFPQRGEKVILLTIQSMFDVVLNALNYTLVTKNCSMSGEYKLFYSDNSCKEVFISENVTCRTIDALIIKCVPLYKQWRYTDSWESRTDPEDGFLLYNSPLQACSSNRLGFVK